MSDDLREHPAVVRATNSIVGLASMVYSKWPRGEPKVSILRACASVLAEARAAWEQERDAERRALRKALRDAVDALGSATILGETLWKDTAAGKVVPSRTFAHARTVLATLGALLTGKEAKAALAPSAEERGDG